MEQTILTSTKPYLVRALHDWIEDNECTPFVIVNAKVPGVEVPSQYVEDGRIILNISQSAVRDLQISNEYLKFNARFNGVGTEVYVPISAILAIYAHENGHGMVFSDDEAISGDTPPAGRPLKKSITRPDPTTKPVFKRVK